MFVMAPTFTITTITDEILKKLEFQVNLNETLDSAKKRPTNWVLKMHFHHWQNGIIVDASIEVLTNIEVTFWHILPNIAVIRFYSSNRHFKTKLRFDGCSSWTKPGKIQYKCDKAYQLQAFISIPTQIVQHDLSRWCVKSSLISGLRQSSKIASSYSGIKSSNWSLERSLAPQGLSLYSFGYYPQTEATKLARHADIRWMACLAHTGSRLETHQH